MNRKIIREKITKTRKSTIINLQTTYTYVTLLKLKDMTSTGKKTNTLTLPQHKGLLQIQLKGCSYLRTSEHF